MRRFIGGPSLAAAILTRELAPGIEPYSPDNLLVMAPGGLTATPVPGSDRLSLAARSPLTGFIGESTLSGPSGEALRRAGFTAVAIVGKAAQPSLLVIDDGRVELRPADHLWGLGILESLERLQAELSDRRFSFMVIGQAGENLVRYASISDQTGRVAGRTGLGAVMGAKNLKAIALRGTSRLPVHDRQALASYVRDLADRFKRPEVAVHGWSGSVRSVSTLTGSGALPVANFQRSGRDGGYKDLGDELLLQTDKLRHGCIGCPVQCEHRFERPRVKGRGRAVRLEYQTVYALGPLCGVDDLDAIVDAASLCDEFGMDSVSMGATIAWAMESRERGVLTLDPTTDPELEFGNPESVIECIRLTARRVGIGALLAEGSRRASDRTGAGSAAWAMHVKGLEMPGYDPRRQDGIGLGLALSARGACHNRAGLGMDPDPAPWEEEIAKTLESSTASAISREDTHTTLDALGICKFFRFAFDDIQSECGDIARMILGPDGHTPDLASIGGRTSTVRRLFNLREGLTPEDDQLPQRLRGASEGSNGTSNADAPRAEYYRQRGWTADGGVPAQTLVSAGMGDFVEAPPGGSTSGE